MRHAALEHAVRSRLLISPRRGEPRQLPQATEDISASRPYNCLPSWEYVPRLQQPLSCVPSNSHAGLIRCAADSYRLGSLYRRSPKSNLTTSLKACYCEGQGNELSFLWIFNPSAGRIFTLMKYMPIYSILTLLLHVGTTLALRAGSGVDIRVATVGSYAELA
jgi:hypothetical protein